MRRTLLLFLVLLFWMNQPTSSTSAEDFFLQRGINYNEVADLKKAYSQNISKTKTKEFLDEEVMSNPPPGFEDRQIEVLEGYEVWTNCKGTNETFPKDSLELKSNNITYLKYFMRCLEKDTCNSSNIEKHEEHDNLYIWLKDILSKTKKGTYVKIRTVATYTYCRYTLDDRKISYYPPENNSSYTTPLVIGAIIIILLILAVVGLVLYFRRRRTAAFLRVPVQENIELRTPEREPREN